MTDVRRRALFGAVLLAPAIAVAGVSAAATPRPDLSGYSVRQVLEHAANTDTDAHFAALCAEALTAWDAMEALDGSSDGAGGDAAYDHYAIRRRAVFTYEPRHGQTLLSQLYLIGASEWLPESVDEWWLIVRDVARLVR